MNVTPDLTERLLKYKPVEMPFHSEQLTPRERRMVAELVAASNYMEDIFWRQSDPKGLSLYQQLAGSTNQQDQQLRRLLFINASRAVGWHRHERGASAREQHKHDVVG